MTTRSFDSLSSGENLAEIFIEEYMSSGLGSNSVLKYLRHTVFLHVSTENIFCPNCFLDCVPVHCSTLT